MSALTRSLAALDLPHSMPRPRRDRLVALSRTARRPTALALGGLALAGYGWTLYIDIDPNSAIPMRTIRGENAYDDFQRATWRLKDESQVAYALRPSKSKNSQSNQDATGSMTLLVPGQAAPADDADSARRDLTLEEKEDLLRLNGPALSALREGFGKQYLAPPLRSFRVNWPFLHSYRSLARLLLLESDLASKRGRWKEAASSALDAIEFGATIQQNSPMTGKLAGIGIELMGRRMLWQAAERLPANDAKKVAARLEKLVERRVPITDSLEEEKWYLVAAVEEAMRKPGWRTEFPVNRRIESGDPVRVGVPGYAAYAFLLPYSKTRIVKNTMKYMDRQIIAFQQPYSSDVPEFFADRPDLINAVIMPIFTSARFTDTFNHAENQLLVTTLALRAYHAEKGRYPVGLSALTPKILQSSPIDPFGGDREISYRLTNAGYLLYSVGPDGNNDGGRPLRTVSGWRSVGEDGPGDIVAGVNTGSADD